MSKYATNFVIDELTGEKRLIKHLNKIKINRVTVKATSGSWNKTGKAARIKKRWGIGSLRSIGKNFKLGRGWNEELLKKFNLVKEMKKEFDMH
jgi:hypothetical protein